MHHDLYVNIVLLHPHDETNTWYLVFTYSQYMQTCVDTFHLYSKCEMHLLRGTLVFFSSKAQYFQLNVSFNWVVNIY
jgi:hypothetical protein